MSQSEYEKEKASELGIFKCTPCWFISKEHSGEVIYEGEFNTDCCIGVYIERYRNGAVKVKGQYKTPKSGIPDYYAGDCRKDGQWTYYTIKGGVSKVEIYKDGKLIK
ncbi:MAG TPA: hypothetical protein VGO45_07300 [Bacteroidia bacterium]|nr:hypothetical protein [Bacteroidia bacterium]